MKEKEQTEKKDASKDLLGKFLKDNKADHLNYDETVKWICSTGSLIFDAELGGGYKPGAYKVTGASFGGKAQPIDEPVLTPYGWVPIGSLKEGDKITDSNGKIQTVLAVYPQGRRDIYEVRFADGARTRCCDEHLWETTTINEKRYGGFSVKPLSYIRKTINYGARSNHTVRLVKPIEFEKTKLPLEPYLLGVLLGDGGITERVDITNTDSEVWDNVSNSLNIQFPDDEWSFYERGITKIITFKKQAGNPLKDILKQMNLFGLKSNDKFIPDEYLHASIEDRISLLQGLIDTDGYISKIKTEVIYYSISEVLIDSFVKLVRSLGGLARKNVKKTSYKNKLGEKIIGKDCFSVSFYLPEGIIPSRISRKKDLYRNRVRSLENRIIDVKPAGTAECVCIRVSAKDSLYVTRDFVLTHNSHAVANCILNALKTVPNSKGLWVKAEGRLDDEIQERSGIKFVFSAEEWDVGTCFVLETNIFETTIDLINNLIKTNPDEYRYFMAIDSVDGLIRRDDAIKDSGESEKVGAAGLLMSVMFKKANLVLNKKGHCLFMINQIRSKIEVDKYAPKDQNQNVGKGGSNASTHAANQVWSFGGRNKSNNIEEGGDVVGHYCIIDLSKGVKERTDIRVKYPVKHGRTGGKSVWVEQELTDLLLSWGFVDKSGAWIKFGEELQDELKKVNGAKFVPQTLQGTTKLREWLEGEPEIVAYLYQKFLKLICQ